MQSKEHYIYGKTINQEEIIGYVDDSFSQIDH